MERAQWVASHVLVRGVFNAANRVGVAGVGLDYFVVDDVQYLHQTLVLQTHKHPASVLIETQTGEPVPAKYPWIVRMGWPVTILPIASNVHSSQSHPRVEHSCRPSMSPTSRAPASPQTLVSTVLIVNWTSFQTMPVTSSECPINAATLLWVTTSQT